MSEEKINISFDVRSDSHGEDPDSASRTLKTYHEILWSKSLPNGKMFHLIQEGKYLLHKSELGEYHLSSDSIIHTYYKWKRMKHIIEELPDGVVESFYDIAYTIGGFIIFPGNKIDGLSTMNQERGTNKKINDRFDLTLECIRRYYGNESSPLSEVISRYDDFFALFTDFKGYCDFFLLQDLVYDRYTAIKFFLPFEGFVSNPLPRDTNEYLEYMRNNLEFLHKRNNRIALMYCT